MINTKFEYCISILLLDYCPVSAQIVPALKKDKKKSKKSEDVSKRSKKSKKPLKESNLKISRLVESACVQSMETGQEIDSTDSPNNKKSATTAKRKQLSQRGEKESIPDCSPAKKVKEAYEQLPSHFTELPDILIEENDSQTLVSPGKQSSIYSVSRIGPACIVISKTVRERLDSVLAHSVCQGEIDSF